MDMVLSRYDDGKEEKRFLRMKAEWCFFWVSQKTHYG
jgi:hypothetical protein